MKKLTLPVLAAFALLLFSCYPGTSTISEGDIVVTNYKEGTTFKGNYATYLIDTIRFISDDGQDGDHSNDADIIAIIKSEMSKLGWTHIQNPTNQVPDIYLAITGLIVKNTSTYVWGGYPWYGGGYPWWGGGWYPYYGYPVYGSYTYYTGTLLMEMMDVKNADLASDKLEVLWNGGINGLLEGSYIRSRFESNIKQTFDQSPYLNIN